MVPTVYLTIECITLLIQECIYLCLSYKLKLSRVHDLHRIINETGIARNLSYLLDDWRFRLCYLLLFDTNPRTRVAGWIQLIRRALSRHMLVYYATPIDRVSTRVVAL